MDKLCERVDGVSTILDILTGAMQYPNLNAEDAALDATLRLVKNKIANVKIDMEQSKTLLEKIIGQHEALEKLQLRMAYLMKNKQCFFAGADQSHKSQGQSPCDTFQLTPQMAKQPVNGKPQTKNTVQRCLVLSPSIVVSTPKPQKSMEIAISFISNSEYGIIPQFMKGRLRFEEINAFVDQYNVVLNKKYSLTNKPKKSIKTKKELDLLLEWKEQVLPELQGQHFVTANDFASLISHKLSKKDFSIVTVLRHVQRIKEVRDKKILYYVARFEC